MKITTWNMQGGKQQGNLGTLIADNDPDVICLQETGDMRRRLINPVAIAGFPNSVTGTYQNRFQIYEVVFWWNNVDANPKNSLAVMCRGTVQASGIFIPIPVAGHRVDNPRNLPWMRVNIGGNVVTIYSYHAPSVNTGWTCRYTNPQVTNIDLINPGANWAVVGDFNADPTDPAFLAPLNGHAVHGNQITQQSGGLLDYSITNVPAYRYSAAGKLLTGSDHWPQNFTY